MKRGFTLIELLFVIAIIGLLSSIMLTSLNASRAKARDVRRVSDIRQIQKALELYATSNGGNYPITPGNSWRSQCSADGSYAPQNIAPGLVPTYISQFPSDPEMNTSSCTCAYKYVSNGTDYSMIDYNCPTANTSNAKLAPLLDSPWFPTAWGVHTAGAQAQGW